MKNAKHQQLKLKIVKKMKSLRTFENSISDLLLHRFENIINERNSFLQQNIEKDIKTQSWFQPNFSRKEAEQYLKDQDIGCFVIRLGHSKDFLALSLKSEDSKCDHYKIELKKGEDDSRLWTVVGCSKHFNSLSSLVLHFSFLKEMLPVVLSRDLVKLHE